jgi:hypothetical protein
VPAAAGLATRVEGNGQQFQEFKRFKSKNMGPPIEGPAAGVRESLSREPRGIAPGHVTWLTTCRSWWLARDFFARGYLLRDGIRPSNKRVAMIMTMTIKIRIGIIGM